MAINSNKLLPQNKNNDGNIVKYKSETYLIPIKNIRPAKSLVDDTIKTDDNNKIKGKKDIVKIKNTVLEIEKILRKNLKLQKKDLSDKLKTSEKEKFKKTEKNLENKEKKQFNSTKNGISLPKLGIFDYIKRFLFWTILGRIITALKEHLPTLIKISEKIIPVVGFVGKLTGDFLNGLVDFIDFGYSAYDKVRNLSKQIGGEPFQKVFDDFSKNLNTFVNLAIIAGLLSTGGFSSPKSSGQTQIRGKIAGRSKYGADSKAVRRYVDRYGKDAAIRRFGQEGIKSLGGKYSRSAATNLTRQGLVATLGKGGTKTLLKFVSPFLKRLPIIGGLISFGLAVAMGEPLGRAAFKSIGAGVLGLIGTGFGGPLGAIIGGMAGDWAGGKLYDIFFNGQKNVDDKSKIKKKATGGAVTGNITRNGKVTGGSITRRIVKSKSIKSSPRVRKLTPGTAIGGKDKVQHVFPEPSKEQKGKMVDPYGFLVAVGNKMTEIKFLGPLFSIFAKTILGEKVTKLDYKNVGLGINAWINNAIVKGSLEGQLNSVKGFADGGIIRREIINDDDMTKNISRWVEKSVEELVKNKVTDAINEFRRNLGLKPLTSAGDEIDPDELGEGGSVRVSSDSPDFWLLATAAMFENSNPQGAADVAQVIYNRTQYPAWNAPTIKQAILNPGQFQPVRKYGGTAAWAAIKTKEDAIKFARTHGKTQEQLERVAAALLNKERQRSAREYVGPRDSFRAEAYEKEVNHLADETEKTRHGHTFGFEPRGATIGAFKAGKLSAAEVNKEIVKGDILETGAGYGSAGSKIAGELGRFMKKKGVVPGSIHRHPEHPPYSLTEGHSPGSLHYQGRAIDLGANANEQGPILKAVAEFNKIKGVKPVELFHAGNDPKGHGDHVHVAYQGGGLVAPPKQNKPNVNPSSLYSYDDEAEVIMMIQPIIIETNKGTNFKSSMPPGFGQIGSRLNSYN